MMTSTTTTTICHHQAEQLFPSSEPMQSPNPQPEAKPSSKPKETHKLRNHISNKKEKKDDERTPRPPASNGEKDQAIKIGEKTPTDPTPPSPAPQICNNAIKDTPASRKKYTARPRASSSSNDPQRHPLYHNLECEHRPLLPALFHALESARHPWHPQYINLIWEDNRLLLAPCLDLI
ncbi:hypothetical protein N9L68_02960 [bacterium]|nr:hypothetical protein [bacterium]